jgi:hypothetical protein
MLDPRFVYLAIALALFGAVRYVIDTWRGSTQPHRVTWTLWALEGILAYAVEIQAHVGLVSLMTLVLGLIPCVVVAASFRNPQAVWKIDRIDVACGAVSLLGLLFWLLVNEPTVALLSFVTADFIAALPTYRKSWTNPESESGSPYIFGALNCAITLLTLHEVTTAGAAFPGIILFTDSVLSVFIVTKLGPRVRQRYAPVA